MTPFDVGNDRQLFLDGRWLDSTSGQIERRLHEPVRCDTAIAVEYPWELGGVSYMVTFPDEGKYRAWYRCDCQMPPKDSRKPLYAYAESSDGINWDKPRLGLVEFKGSTDNNLVWAGPGNNLSLFRDDGDGVPESASYKGIVRAGDLFALVSPDGLRWTLLQDEPIHTERPFDSHNITFFDERLGEYVIYARGVAGVGDFKGGVRWIRRSRSTDFCTWSDWELIDIGEQPREHLYTNACIPYDRASSTYLMFPSRFVKEREPIPDWEYGPGVNDIVFMSSRDGLHFDRSFREAFVRPGPDPHNWHERAIYMEHGLLHTSATEMSLFGMENWRMDSVRISRYSLRTDGFVSVRSGYAGGTFATPPLIFGQASELEINFATSAAGSIGVEILDGDGGLLAGYRLPAEIYGDKIAGRFRFEERNLQELAGSSVRLRFTLQDADIYAFRFC